MNHAIQLAPTTQSSRIHLSPTYNKTIPLQFNPTKKSTLSEIDVVFEAFLPDMNDKYSQTVEQQHLEHRFPSYVAQSIDAGTALIVQGTLEIEVLYPPHHLAASRECQKEIKPKLKRLTDLLRRVYRGLN